MKKNTNKVLSAISAVFGMKSDKKKAKKPTCAKKIVKLEDKLDTASNIALACALVPAVDGEDWSIVPGMLVEDDFKDD